MKWSGFPASIHGKHSGAGAWAWSSTVLIALGAALSGCVTDCHADMLVEGTGYQLVHIFEWNGTSGISMADADFSPDGRTIGVLLSNGTVQFWTSAGAQMHNRPWNWDGATAGAAACNEMNAAIRFLNDTAIVAGCGRELRAVNVSCEVLWRADVPEGARIGGMAVAEGGRALVLANPSGPALLWQVPGGANTSLTRLSPQADAVAASPSGRRIATIGGGTFLSNVTGEDVQQYTGTTRLRSGIALSDADDQTFAVEYRNLSSLDLDVVINRANPGDLEMPARVGFTNQSLTPDLGTDYSAVGGVPDWHGRPPLLSVSASGQFVGIQAGIRLLHIDYYTTTHVILVANREAPQQMMGFHVMDHARVKIADNGTALAISSSVWGLWLVHAAANATLPVRALNPQSSWC
jgi:hypothetical protein